MSESETDYGSSPCKTVPDADKQILEWTSRLELETVQLRDTSESLFKIIKENVGELAECRRLFQRQLEKEKEQERQKGLYDGYTLWAVCVAVHANNTGY
ncbi:protein REC107 [Kluyveromyces marxianus]|uniref:Mer2 super family protein n=2 Tax=Kluyveromyces marxianus TaxID=4911 RepID=W0TDF0_KLUMD|nr:mer2 super family protein [Kluyveromyces marxianus DMKU3-1042]QGN17482.1 protein REC107 [Kluyveromyces marxianus]BAO41375.1 mer2 super family protein [Kluyveromyces marxianus DMKU3-1042]